MKKIVGITLIGLMVLTSGPALFARGHGRPGPSYHHHYHHRRPPHRSCGWSGRDTFGAICAGILGAGLIIAATSGPPPARRCVPAYVPPPPPPPVYYPAPVYYVPVYR